MYRSVTADLFRIATQGTGTLPEGDIHPDLARRLSLEAATCAERILQMCIRAIDYCPPVDITFGDFLRGVVSADIDYAPADKNGFRVVFIESFREWGIYPRGIRSMGLDALAWPTGDELAADLLGPRVQSQRSDRRPGARLRSPPVTCHHHGVPRREKTPAAGPSRGRGDRVPTRRRGTPPRRHHRTTLDRLLPSGPERPDLAGAVPRRQRLGVVPESVAVEPVHHPNQLDQLVGHRKQVGADPDVIPAAGMARLDGFLELGHLSLEVGRAWSDSPTPVRNSFSAMDLGDSSTRAAIPSFLRDSALIRSLLRVSRCDGLSTSAEAYVMTLPRSSGHP
jgi:hypothetical protein